MPYKAENWHAVLYDPADHIIWIHGLIDIIP